MKVKSTLTLGAVTAASTMVLIGAGIEFPISQACAQEPKSPGVSFAEDIAPILKGWCAECHRPGGEGYNASGLDLTSYDGLMTGAKFGPMVLPGQPDNSNLVVLIDGRAKVTMPFRHKALPNCLRNNIWSWIFEGAKNN